MKNLLVLALLIFFAFASNAQGYATFIDYQKAFTRPGDALKRKEDTLQKQFAAKNLAWPAKYLYIRSFKYDGELEVWVKNERKDPYKLFKTYKVCALAGSLGPKRMQGDYQVPEGFYYINEFNPNSNYYLSLGINYPNASDKILSDSLHPGGDIYIHGSCVTVGCIPVTDKQIDEIYILSAFAKNNGQDFIPVHIYPVRYKNKRSAEYLSTITRADAQLKSFSERLENVYDHFEVTRQLPVIMINKNGEYVYDGLSKKVNEAPREKPKKAPVQHRFRNVTNIAEVVHQWPQFPGGSETFFKYLNNMGKALVPLMPEGRSKANVMIEFIIDEDGTPTNFKVLNGVSEEFDDELISILEEMPLWTPAVLNDKPVAKRMKQSFVVQ
jgi:murein L,D-transpeptidase YafK